ncbi:MAG TPA: transporter [Pyrinomonadaceae bacterium]
MRIKPSINQPRRANNQPHRAKREQRRRLLSLSLLALLFITTAAARAQAQQFVARTTDSLPEAAEAIEAADEDEDFIKPTRPGVTNPAEFQRPGVLQLELGYEGNFRARDVRADQSLPLALRFAATSRLLLEVDLDVLKSQTDEARLRETGIGDTRVGLQIVAIKETEAHPALAFAYYAKLPSASAAKGLGTGRVDHKIVLLLSRKFGETDVDFNGAYLIVGREDAGGWVTGGQAGISVAREYENHFGVEAELSGQSKDDSLPPGLYALGALTYKANRRVVFDTGLRFGLNHDAPRVGVFAGLTIGVADFYRRKP